MEMISLKSGIYIIIILIRSFVFIQNLNESPQKNEIIQYAINDFSKTSKLYKKNKSFSVTFHDTITSLSQIQKEDGIFYPQTDKVYYNISGVSITPIDYIFFLPPEPIIGDKRLPNNFFEIEGKLFYWHNKEDSLSQESLDLIKKYNLIQFNENGLVIYPDLSTDDSQKAVDYYFCKNNFKIFKKVISKIGIGYYTPPKLNCK